MENLPPAVSDPTEAADPKLRARIEERAYSLWESDGRPEGRALDYWLQAEQEILAQAEAARARSPQEGTKATSRLRADGDR